MTDKMMMNRVDGREWDVLRPILFERNFSMYAEGSVLVSCGNTKVLCTASVEDKVPRFLRGSGQGWVTAEYSLLPRSTSTRVTRDVVKGSINGRSHEIQRLIGRSLRAAVDMSMIGERTIWIDCDVLQADGGTRTAAITGGFVALADALRKMWHEGKVECIPLKAYVAAISAGKVNGNLLLDLCYEEDSRAEVDLNVVLNSENRFIEIQGTGEGDTFSGDELNGMLDLARRGIDQIITLQQRSLAFTDEEVEAIASA